MAKKKHRGSSKIKYEHSMLQGLRKWLESIESWTEIKSIIPARIRRSGSSGDLEIKVQYQTPTGVKCLARGKGAVQEIFIVSSDPSALEKRLRRFLG